MNRWIFALIGQIVGIILFTNSEHFYGTRDINDITQMIGFGFPYAAIGFILGYFAEKIKKKS